MSCAPCSSEIEERYESRATTASANLAAWSQALLDCSTAPSLRERRSGPSPNKPSGAAISTQTTSRNALSCRILSSSPALPPASGHIWALDSERTPKEAE
jgi:hypothetical protein